jgi:hypothetical protein
VQATTGCTTALPPMTQEIENLLAVTTRYGIEIRMRH